MKTKVKIVAVDGTWLMHRAFHVRPASVPYMVFGWVCRYAFERKATHLVVCFDSGRSFRHDIYDGYKANREGGSPVHEYEKPLQGILRKANIGFVLGEANEADDLLATIGHSVLMTAIFGNDISVELVTPDKDNLQCITKVCHVLRPGVSGNPDVLWDFDKLKSETGLSPSQQLDLQTLTGDATDAIPQIMSEGKAKKLILKHGTLKAYLNSDMEFTEAHEVELRRNRKLVKLLTECFDFEPDLYKVSSIIPNLDLKSTYYHELTAKRKSLFS